MKMITAQELQQHLNRYLREAQSEEIVITLDDGTLVALSSLDADDLADAEIERDPRFAQLITERRSRYQQIGGVSLYHVRQDLIDELTQDLTNSDPSVRQEAADLLGTLRKLAATK
jgi:hypothetical protein